VKELLSHLSGVAADVVRGNVAEAGTEPWVAVQVAARRDRTIEEIADEWRATGPQVDEVCTALGDALAQLIFDTVTHEQDLRVALGQPGVVDGAVDIGLRWAADAWGADPGPGNGSLQLRAGTLEATRGDGEPVVAVDLEAVEALAALTGRRSLGELRAYEWTGDVEPWLPAFTWGPFVPPGT
jgi:uncharacterized protein (TIGR03083 family)